MAYVFPPHWNNYGTYIIQNTYKVFPFGMKDPLHFADCLQQGLVHGVDSIHLSLLSPDFNLATGRTLFEGGLYECAEYLKNFTVGALQYKRAPPL